MGINVPLIRKNYKARIAAASIDEELAEARYEEHLLDQQIELGHLLHDIEKYEASIQYYQEGGRLAGEALEQHAYTNYTHGESDYSEYLIQMEQALDLQLDYLENLLGFNQTIIEIKALLGE